MKHKRPNVKRVVRRQLCTGCGVCAGICPHDAVGMVISRKQGQYIPRIDQRKCRRCGLCLDACPGHSVDFEGLSRTLMGDIPEDIALGKYLCSYVGHATDDEMRYRGASGGLVTALLVCALERGLIDGALVTRMRPGKPLEAKPFIARTKEEIVLAARSKYCPVPAGAAVSKILASEGRFAVVGLPCHIQGIRKAEQHLPKLRERVRYHVSIACSINYSFQGTEKLLGSLKIPPQSVETLEYRGRGWPGSMYIRQDDGDETVIPYKDGYKKLSPYSLRRCTLCSDMLGELSDLSCGDAWVPRVMKEDKVGSSFVLTRTAEGEELLEAAAADEYIEVSDLDPRDLAMSQNRAVFKKRKLSARMALFRWTGKPVPKYRQKLLRPISGDYGDMIKFYVARYALSGNRPVLRRLFQAARYLKRAGRGNNRPE
jgi:coenzyme F420 hydrogenase subunit beta